MTTKSYSQRKRNATPDGDSASPPKEGAASGSQSMKTYSYREMLLSTMAALMFGFWVGVAAMWVILK